MPEALIARELLDVVTRLSAARTIDDIAGVVRASARSLTGADGVTFILRDGDLCYYADEDAITPLWKGRRFPMESCISGWVMLNRRPASIPDIYLDPRIPHDAYRPTFVRSLLVVPIRRDDPLAAIGAYWAELGKPNEEALEVLQALADACALAIANLGLYAELEQALESERTARRSAEEANRLKDEFLATLSHELRTPLHIIQGWLWQLRQPNTTTETQQRGLETIERNARLQARLVDDLLDMSRAMSGKLRLELTAVDLAEVCGSVAEVAAPSAEAKGVKINLHVDQPSALIRGDVDRLQQVLWNVVSNAIKFGSVGGSIDIRLRRRPGGVCVEVADDGIGIEPSFLPFVFDPFRQADTGTTRRYGGLGLGLAIVRHLTQLHGGTVHAESAGPGCGTTVVLDFPILSAVEAAGSSRFASAS